MGKLMEALTAPSAYRAKKTGIWDEITDRIAGAQTPYDLDLVEVWLLGQELNIPRPWEEHIVELLELRREALKAEDIGSILRDRFDFK